MVVAALVCMYAVHCIYNAYLGLFLGGSPRFRQQMRRCVSSGTEHSSLQMTSWNPSVASLAYIRAHSSRFSLSVWRISWQYALPWKVHPSNVRHLRTVRKDRLSLHVTSRLCSCVAVILSSSLILASTTLYFSEILLGRPLPGCRAIVLLSP